MKSKPTTIIMPVPMPCGPSKPSLRGAGEYLRGKNKIIHRSPNPVKGNEIFGKPYDKFKGEADGQ